MEFLFRGISPLRFSFEKRIYIENYMKMSLQASIFTYIIKYYRNKGVRIARRDSHPFYIRGFPLLFYFYNKEKIYDIIY